MNELVVTYVAGATPAARDGARGLVRARLAERVVVGSRARSEVELVTLPSGIDRARAIEQLERHPSVAYAEPNWIYTHHTHQHGSTDSAFLDGRLWGMYGPSTFRVNRYGSNAGAAWAAGRTGSTSVYVGVIDEGIQNTHPDLAGQVRNPRERATPNGVDDDGNGYIDDIYGWDFTANDNSVYDGTVLGISDSHGTHVAGTIGAKANGVGVVGVNFHVRMISAKFLGPVGGTSADAIKAIDYFTDLKRRGLNIVATNNSWGGGGYSQALRDAIERANNANILFVAAAGNDDNNNDIAPSYPASYSNSNIIAVAAITRSGSKATFSNYGARSVDLGAPGHDIWSTVAYDAYKSYSGTSMAAPHVTGAAALYASVKPRSSAAAIKKAILDSAVPTTGLSGRTVTGGRLDVNAALRR